MSADDSRTDASRRSVFFHAVVSDPPTLDDFTSNTAKGRLLRRPLTAEEQELWRGISAYESWSLARRKVGASPWLGEYIAEMAIPSNSQIIARRTTNSRGHWTLWGSPEELLACVVAVTPLTRRG